MVHCSPCQDTSAHPGPSLVTLQMVSALVALLQSPGLQARCLSLAPQFSLRVVAGFLPPSFSAGLAARCSTLHVVLIPCMATTRQPASHPQMHCPAENPRGVSCLNNIRFGKLKTRSWNLASPLENVNCFDKSESKVSPQQREIYFNPKKETGERGTKKTFYNTA